MVWDPIESSKLSHQLEMVQRKALRWIYNRWQYDESPTVMLNELNLDTLKYRRTTNRLSMLHELHHGSKFLPTNTIHRQRCADIRFKRIYGSIKCYSNSFYPYTIYEWNELPCDVVNALDLNTFKKGLKQFQY